MDALGDLLRRLPIPGLKDSNERHHIAEAVTELTTVPVTAKQISFKDNILYLSVPPVVKSAILIKKQELQETLRKRGIEVREVR